MHSVMKSRKTTVVAVVMLAAVTAMQPVFAAKAKPKPKPAPKPVAVSAPAAPKIIKVVDIYTADPITLKQTGSKIQVTLAPEEYEPAPIIVKSPKAISGVKVALYNDLVGPAKLAKANASAWIVDGGVMRKDSTTRTAGDPVADLSTGTQPFWLTFYAPKGTKPGVYKGYVTASTDKAIGSIPVEVTVLPIRLLRSSKQYGMLVPHTSADVSVDVLKTYLSTTYEAGFSVGALNEPASSAADVFAAYKASKLGVHGIYAGFANASELSSSEVGSVNSARRTSGASELYFLGADCPKDDEALSAAQTRLRTMAAAGVRTAARIDSEEAYEYLKDDLKAVIYDPDLPYIQALSNGQTRSNGKREWYYWDASEDAMKNRIYSGVKLWKSGLDGAYVEPGKVSYNGYELFSEPKLLIPAEDGVLPTVEWESLREGIDDTRYITTMMAVLREAKDQKVGKTITDAAEAYVNAFLKKPFDSLTNSELAKFRVQVAQYIVKLKSVVK